MHGVEKIIWRTSGSGPRIIDANDFIKTKNGLTTRSFLVNLGPGEMVANHKHAQYEILIGFSSELYVVWKNKHGERCEESLTSGHETLQALVIAPHVPHLIENRSKNIPAVIQVWQGIIDDPVALAGDDSLRNTT